MRQTTLTLGHSPDPDDAFMFYALAKDLIPTHGFRFQHILQDIQTLNEHAIRGERGHESIRRFLDQAFERGLVPHRQELEFVV